VWSHLAEFCNYDDSNCCITQIKLLQLVRRRENNHNNNMETLSDLFHKDRKLQARETTGKNYNKSVFIPMNNIRGM